MPIASFRPTGLVTPTDVPAHAVSPDYWTRADNMLFRDIFAEQTPGWSYIYDENAVIGSPLFVQNSFFLGTNYWLYGFANGVGVTASDGVHTDLTPTTNAPSGTTSADWNGCDLNGYPVLNWRGVPHSWDRSTSNNVQALTDWPTGYTAKVMRAHRFNLWALNIGGGVEYPSVVMWSTSAAPGLLPDDGNNTTWTPHSGNDAGSLSLGDTGRGINDGLTLGENLLVYKAGSAYSIFPTGDADIIYGQRQFLRTQGALTTNCVAEWQGLHAVFGDGDIYLTNGQADGTRSIVDRATRRTLFSELAQGSDDDGDLYERCFVTVSPNTNEVIFAYVVEGGTYPTKCLVWDAGSDTTAFKDTVDVFGQSSFRDIQLGGSGTPHIAHGNVSRSVTLPTYATTTDTYDTTTDNYNTWDVSEATDGLVTIDIDNDKLAWFDNGITQEVGDLRTTLQREALDFGDPDSVKLVSEVWPKMVGNLGDVIRIRVGSQMEPSDEISWSPYVDYTIGSSRKIDTFAQGRFLSFEFLGENVQPWRCTGFEVNLERAGRY